MYSVDGWRAVVSRRRRELLSPMLFLVRMMTGSFTTVIECVTGDERFPTIRYVLG